MFLKENYKIALFSFDIFILNICPNMVGYGIDVYSYFNVFNGINIVQNFSSKYLLKMRYDSIEN